MLIPRSVFSTVDVASKDPCRWQLTGLLIDRKDGKPRAIACDGKTAMLTQWEESPGEDYPDRGISTKHEKDFSVILPAATCKLAPKCAPAKFCKPILTQVLLEESTVNGTVKLFGTDLDHDNLQCAKTVEGTYPDVDSVLLKKRTPQATVKLNLRYLMEACATMLKVLDAGKAVDICVDLELHGEHPVALKAKSNDISVTGFVMPLIKS